MPIKEGLTFVYDGISSSEKGLINVSIDGGLFEESFLPQRKIEEVKVRGNDKPYFSHVDKEPLSFDLEFAFEDGFTKSQLRDVARWLDQDYYREFYFPDYPSRRLFCMVNDSSDLIHNGDGEGYIKLTMRCDSSYSYSQEYLTPEIDFTMNVAEGTNYEFQNAGDVLLKPELWITKVGDGDVTIENTSDGEIFQFTGLKDGEQVYINNKREEIETDLAGVYRYDNFNDTYLYLLVGRNILNVKGDCKLRFRHRFKLLQG